MSQLKKKKDEISTLYSVLVKEDLNQLSEAEKVAHLRAVCESLNLNPLTNPFGYIMLNGKLKLYAKKDATEQLRKNNKVSIKITDRKLEGDIFIVTAQAINFEGRMDESTGAVNIGGLKGDGLANAYMKAETKAKRRVTLSICGLGFLDETEVETVPDAKITEFKPVSGVFPKEMLGIPEPKKETPAPKKEIDMVNRSLYRPQELDRTVDERTSLIQDVFSLAVKRFGNLSSATTEVKKCMKEKFGKDHSKELTLPEVRELHSFYANYALEMEGA